MDKPCLQAALVDAVHEFGKPMSNSVLSAAFLVFLAAAAGAWVVSASFRWRDIWCRPGNVRSLIKETEGIVRLILVIDLLFLRVEVVVVIAEAVPGRAFRDGIDGRVAFEKQIELSPAFASSFVKVVLANRAFVHQFFRKGAARFRVELLGVEVAHGTDQGGPNVSVARLGQSIKEAAQVFHDS